MNTLEFLRAILPPEGVYLIAAHSAKGFRHKGFTSLEDAAAFAMKCDASGVPTYHACAAYKAAPYRDENGKLIARTSSNWLAAKAFWSDIDCGHTKALEGKGYATQKEGAKALLGWCKSKGLPFPMLVNSGRGIHAYWCLTKPLLPKEWVQVASALKSVMQADNLLIDPSRASDFASVLRPVGSFNRKDPANPKEVKVVLEQKEPIDTDTFCAKVAELLANSDTTLGPIPPWLMGEEPEPIPYTPLECSAEACADKCAQVRAMRDTQGDVGYDHWRGVIGLIKHCTEGIELARAWSARRAETGHSSLDVDTRFSTWESAPPTCEFFERCNASGCEGCPFKGKIKTPIVLGRIEPEPQTEEVEGVLEVKTSEPVTVEVPELPKGYEWDGTCMVRYVPNKDGVLEAHPFCKVRFYLIDRIRNAEGKFEFVARAHFPKGIIREFNIPGNIVGGGGSKLLEVLGAYEIMTLNTKDATAQMAAYIKDAVNKLTEQKAVTSTHTSFGWQPDGSFLMGNRLYKPTGEVTEVLLSGYAYDNYAAFPPPKGTVEAYSEKLNWIYNRKGMEPMQYLICSLFGAPLTDLAEPTYNGIPCALTGADSGKGKTTAAMVALYAFGRAFPDMVISGKQGATVKAQAALLGTFGNLPVLFDEITNVEKNRLSDLCYALSNGVENMRLRSAAGRVAFSQRESWRTQVAMTANSCLLSKLASRGNTEAEAMRVFEIRVDQYDIPKLDPVEVSAAVAEIEKNMGCAGEVFIKYLVTHRALVSRMLMESYQLFNSDPELMTEPKYRFYRNHMAVTMTAAKILTELNIIKFDLKALRVFAMDAAHRMVEEAETHNSMDCEEALSRMISDMSPKIITTPTYQPETSAPPYPVVAPMGIVGRAIRGNDVKRDKYHGRLFLSARAIQYWCDDNRVDCAKLRRELKGFGFLLDSGARVTLGRGTTVVTAQQRCWELDLRRLEEGTNNVES